MHRVFWTYWAAGTISATGSAVTVVALPIAALTLLQASPQQVGLLTAAGFVAWLVIGLPAGVLAQRLPLRGTQVAMDLLRAAALASVPLAWWAGHLTFAHLVVTALVVSFATVLFDVSNSTFLPSIVPKEEMQRRNSLMSGTHAASSLGGPALGGLLVQLTGAAAALGADAVSYLISAALLRSLPAREVAAPPVWPPVRQMIREGWHFVSRHPVMAPFMWDATVINFVCGAQMALFAVYLLRVQDAPPVLVGVLLAAEGVGALLGAAATPRITGALGTARASVLASVGTAVFALVIPAGAGLAALVLFALGNIGFAASVALVSISTRTYRMTATPPELLPRVMATVRFVSWGAIPVGSVTAGLAAGVVGARGALWAAAVVAWLGPAILLRSQVRSLRDLDDHASPRADAEPAGVVETA
ncbi:MAG: MFS transporter [Frankiales bacterium]|nr:MFS transporter [Frankiales bacterium]